ncbi:MAG: SsrA-binding protein [Actinobacteria bacterium]|nr:SsrA-binding protein [Actinomycetota bacterium]
MKPTGTSVLASNRKARHDFTIIDVVEAGIVLLGSEVKSLRTGQVQLADAYARVVDGEVWLEGAEIRRFRERIMKDRLTLVPLSIILRDGKVKVELALAQGRTKGDKRQAIAERDVKREIQREISQRNRR